MAASSLPTELGHPGLESLSYQFHEAWRFIVDQGQPWSVVLIWIADVDVPFGNELFDRANDFGAVLGRGELG